MESSTPVHFLKLIMFENQVRQFRNILVFCKLNGKQSIMIISSHLIFIFLALAWFLAGCDQGPLRPEQRARTLQDHMRPGLDFIFPELALIDANNQFFRMNHCAISRSVDWSSVLCPVFQKSEAFTSALAQAVMQSKKELRKGYLFYVKPRLRENRFDLLGLILTKSHEEPIGLFETDSDCRRSEETFRKNGMRVKNCRVWSEEDIQYRIFDKNMGKEIIQHFNFFHPTPDPHT